MDASHHGYTINDPKMALGAIWSFFDKLSLRFFGAKRDGKWALLEKITVIRSFFVDFSIMVHLPSRIGQKSIKKSQKLDRGCITIFSNIQ